MKNVILLLTTALLCCLACQTVPDQQPSKPTIEQYLDRDVRVFGSWAAVKLPVSSGVTIWDNSPTLTHFFAGHETQI